MNEIYETIGRLSAQIAKSTNPDERTRLNAELVQASGKLPRPTRKAQFDVESCERFNAQNGHKGLDIPTLYRRPARTDEEREAAHALDRLYLVSELLKKDPRRTLTYRQMLEDHPSIEKALDTTTGSDWIPVEFSASMHERVRLGLQLAGLMEQIQMPSATYRLPVEGNDARAYLIDEQGDADADLDTSKRVKATLGTPGLTHVELAAKKVGCRTVASTELVEDAVLPMTDYLLSKISRALAEAREDAVINGKRSAGLDADVTAPDDARRWFDGLRQIALDAGQGNAQAVVAVNTPPLLQVNDLRRLRSKLKKFATRMRSGDVVIAASSVGYNALLNMNDGNGNPIISTVDKYGSQATLVTGELARLDGMPIVLSDFVREDLNHAGLYDGITTDSTMLLMVNRTQFLLGSYRNPTIRSQPIITTDQIEIVGLQRGDFRPWFPTQPAVGYLYDVRF
jgi:HK97 family phage major capsid protein